MDGSPDKFFGKVGNISFYYAEFSYDICEGKCVRIPTWFYINQHI